jgi:hypothetical protein
VRDDGPGSDTRVTVSSSGVDNYRRIEQKKRLRVKEEGRLKDCPWTNAAAVTDALSTERVLLLLRDSHTCEIHATVGSLQIGSSTETG